MSRHNYSQYSNNKNKQNNQAAEAVEEVDVVIPEATVEPVIDVTPAVATEVKAVETKAEIETVTGTVANCAKLNVRANPSATADVVCVLDAASEIEINVKDSTHEWFKVCTATGVEGFCMRKFVTANL